jgi:hypothetical protein
LPDTEDGATPNCDIEQPTPPPVRPIWGVSYIKRKFQEYKAKHKNETAADKAARRTAHATWWIAAFTVVLAVASIRTLTEIHEGGKDTHALAVAAGQQATAAETSANAAKSAANTANETLKASRRSFVLEQRPYLITDTPRFVRSPSVDGQAIEVNITFKNIGKTPAINRRTFLSLLRFRGIRKTNDPVKDARGIDAYFTFIEGAFRDLYRRAAGSRGKYGPFAREDVAPGAQPFSTAVNENPLTAQELIDLRGTPTASRNPTRPSFAPSTSGLITLRGTFAIPTTP